jgi:SAM-dependent methyltransferase
MTEPRNEQVPDEAGAIVDRVRERYGTIAEGKTAGCCPGEAEVSSCAERDMARKLGYGQDELESAPGAANLGLGCGAPVAVLDLQPGETVLDLGSGGGLDAFLAARRVGPDGHVIGVDMTPQMIGRARENARAAGFDQVEFRQGRLEQLPVEDASVDAVTSNCVINLVPDKRRVFEETYRVLRPGGRLVISDIVLDGKLPSAVERDLLAWVGCVAGAMYREDYFRTIREVGLDSIEILRDVDFLAKLEKEPPEFEGLLERNGVRREELLGIVRSVTYRAVKRA